MSDLTPQNSFPIPVEFEEPYYPVIKSYFLANDMATWALSENHNLIWSGGGIFSWSAVSGNLVWSAQVEIRSKTTAYATIIPGPPLPGGQTHLNDGEVAFFQLPRLLVANQLVPAPLQVSPITLLPGVRLHDTKIFACRIGTTVFFADGKSLKDGEAGQVFGNGIGSTITPHEHQPAVIIEPATAGVSLLNLNIGSFSPGLLKKVSLYRNGELMSSPADYTVVLSTGTVTLTVATLRPNLFDPSPERFVAFMETTPPVITNGQHSHLADRLIEPIFGTFQLDMLVTSLDYPALSRIELYRNGDLQSEPADFSLNLVTGLVTLVVPTVGGERFVAHREVQY